MSRDIDEDLIEATIRRVQEQAARASDQDDREQPPEGAAEPDASAGEPGFDEAAIASAIERVAQSKAARESEASRQPVTDPGDPVEAAILHAESSPASPPVESDEGGSDAIRRRFAAVLDEPARSLREETPRIDSHRTLEETVGELLERVERLSDRVALLERGASDVSRFARDNEPGGDLIRPQYGAPPVRPVMRDPSPRTATAAQLEPVDRPTPVPLRAVPLAPPAAEVDARRGLDLLPRAYRITVEDKRRGVDLVPLHRALLAIQGVRDMSLLSYTNGVAIVAVETEGPLEPDALRAAVSRAMAREATVEVHNEQTMVVKVAEE